MCMTDSSSRRRGHIWPLLGSHTSQHALLDHAVTSKLERVKGGIRTNTIRILHRLIEQIKKLLSFGLRYARHNPYFVPQLRLKANSCCALAARLFRGSDEGRIVGSSLTDIWHRSHHRIFRAPAFMLCVWENG